ncbi:uncharacterized protein LOC135123981 [Zophobas morio]|uniref:uncharacterized protein LOC135123981 n=1 Tax=Zophobas morio TaxID=2755281 RepID=UPI0030828147
MSSHINNPFAEFSKRKGTTDKGKDYEHLYVAYVLLNLVMDESVEYFYVSSNDENYGVFDDVVIHVKYVGKEAQTLAVQLKHSNENKKDINVADLSSPKGKYFSMYKYHTDYIETVKKIGHFKAILLTNRSLNGNVKQLEIDKETVTVQAEMKQDDFINKLLNTSGQANNYSYVFTPTNPSSDFFKNFHLYTNQANVSALEAITLKLFQDSFDAQEPAFNEFKNVIIRWSMIDGSKNTLDKTFVKNLIALTALSPYVKTLALSDNSLINNNEQAFRDAVSEFKITTLSKNYEMKVRNLWTKSVEGEINEEEFKYLSTLLTPLDNIAEINDAQKTKIFWLMGKSPLVVDECAEFYKIQNLVENKNILILCSARTEESKNNMANSVFENLSDLAKETTLYDRILDTFTYSLEGQAETTLRKLISVDNKIADLITTDRLVEMIDGPTQFGKEADQLPSCHISRTLSKVIVGVGFLQSVEDNLIIIHDVEDKETMINKLKKVEINNEGITKITFHNNNSRSNVMYIVDSELDYEEFREYAHNTTKANCHQFRYLENGQNDSCLEWIRSKNHVDELSSFRVDHQYDYSKHESTLCGKVENDINVVCANAGMGKSTLAKSLKIGSCSSVWTLIINAREHAAHYSEMRQNIKEFLTIMVSVLYKDSPEKKIFQKFIEKKKVRIIWDGLDEVSDKNLTAILEVVQEIAKSGIKQWVTSRKNLKDKLEEILKTFSIEIQEFNEEQQREYIQTRLNLSEADASVAFEQVKLCVPFLDNNLLGVPLQIYLLTEFLLSKSDVKLFLNQNNEIITVVDLYENFVDEKCRIYYTEKRNINLNIDQNRERYITEKQSIIDNYAVTAFDFYIGKNSKNTCSIFFCSSRSNETEFLEKIRNDGDPVGLINKVDSNLEPEFIHNSYGEYFAAIYLHKNDPKRSRDQNFICNDKYNNIRLFLDLLLLAGFIKEEKRSCVAILYKNYKLLPRCGSMTAQNLAEELRLSCAWSKKYPLITSSSISQDNIARLTNTGDTLNCQKILKRFENIKDSLHICVKNLMLLLPFLIPMYNSNAHCFYKEHLLTILFYVIKFDFAFVFACNKDIDWLKNIHQSIDSKVLVSLITKYRSFNCLEVLIKQKKYGDTLLHNVMSESTVSDLRASYYLFSRLHSEAQSVQSVHAIFSGKSSVEFHKLLSVIKVDGKDNLGRMQVHYACEVGDIRRLKALVSKSADLNASDNQDKRPIHYACEIENYNMVKLLVEQEVALDVWDSLGRTPLHYICNKGNFKIAELLVNACPNVDVKDQEGKTPLHFACQKGHRYIVELLLSKGSDRNIADNNNKKPIDCVPDIENDSYISAIKEMLSE